MSPPPDDHLGSLSVLGPPLPRNPWSRVFLASPGGVEPAVPEPLTQTTRRIRRWGGP